MSSAEGAVIGFGVMRGLTAAVAHDWELVVWIVIALLWLVVAHQHGRRAQIWEHRARGRVVVVVDRPSQN